MTTTLSRRQLNRALLARQMLLERVERPVGEVVEHLAPLQAQVPVDPYVALWSRIRDFDPLALSGMLERRAAVRGTLHRATLHLATARDFLACGRWSSPWPSGASARAAHSAASSWASTWMPCWRWPPS